MGIHWLEILFIKEYDSTLEQCRAILFQVMTTLYRQDTVNKKVYIQNIFEPFNDTLIYDFDVDLGDTLHNILYFGGNDSSLYCCIWVDQIDSIQTIEGKPFPLYKKWADLIEILSWFQ